MNQEREESEVEEYWKHSQVHSPGRPKFRAVRRTSSMTDLMKYSMALATEVPPRNFRDKQNDKCSSVDDGDPEALFKQAKRDILKTPDNIAEELRRIRTESEPCRGISRSNTWYNSSLSMDQTTDHVDGIFSHGHTAMRYDPVSPHWFFCRKEKDKDVWVPFTFFDSKKLEESWQRFKRGETEFELVPTQGDRYDVNLRDRKLCAVYWDEETYHVRRGTWFWKAVGEVWVPYEEVIADKLEGEFKLICKTGEWQKRIDLPGGEQIILHSESTMIHYDASKSWTDVAETLYKNQKNVKRGWEGVCLPDPGEWEPIDHVVFVSHGIGSFCDLKWRTLNQCVDAYRLMTRNLLRDHFNFSGKKGRSFRVEFIPINWHSIIHSDNTELEDRIKRITLPSIPIVRYFANDYVLDILFYSSPMYCKIIADHVGDDMNRLHAIFRQRNPGYKGGFSIVGHSLGSIVLFDMLSHQPNANPSAKQHKTVDANFSTISTELSVQNALSASQDHLNGKPGLERRESTVSAAYTVPPFMGAGYPSIRYPTLKFNPACFFAIGSPIGMFLAVRGVTNIGEDYCLPTCPRFLNIFHPTDPVAYRIEPLIIPEACKVPPSVIDHHKGRKRLHLEVQKNIATVASSLKSRLWDPIRSFTNYMTKPSRGPIEDKKQPGVNATSQSQSEEKPKVSAPFGPAAPTPSTSSTNNEIPKIRSFGQLNEGNRIDHVLQEAPLESLNQYLFALHSHAVYWDSEDTLLFMLRQIIDIERDNISVSLEESEQEDVYV